MFYEGCRQWVKWTLQTLKIFHAKHVGCLGYGEMPRGASHQIRLFLSPHMLTFLLNLFPGKSHLSDSLSLTHQLRFLHCHKEKSPKQTVQCSSGQFRCLAFISHYFQLKTTAELTPRKVLWKGRAFPCQLPTWFLCLCVSPFCPLLPVFDVVLCKTLKPSTQSICSQN